MELPVNGEDFRQPGWDGGDLCCILAGGWFREPRRSFYQICEGLREILKADECPDFGVGAEGS